MIEKSIIKNLGKKHFVYNFWGLISLMEKSGLDFKNKKLQGQIGGMASLDCIYLDIDKLDLYSDRFVFYAVLHEIAHLKRINKIGKEVMLEMLSVDNFSEYFNYVIREEIIADRYASLMFYSLNKEILPIEMTQQLHLPARQEIYKPRIEDGFNVYKNDMEIYEKAIKKYIIE